MQMIRISAQTHITRACGATSKLYLRLGDLDDFKFGNCVFLVIFSKNDQLCLVENSDQLLIKYPSATWGSIGYHSRTLLERIAGILNSQRYISEVLEPVVLPYLQGLATAIFQQDNARPHVARIIQRFFVNHQIELLSCPTRSPDLSPIENMWSMVAQ
ncbi:transposable element Tcb1 transposase [Trichonephila clavipes]|nr:transposable element Tcb1 transposase [Trichonephila clavipes]